jgi:hypothetical protein
MKKLLVLLMFPTVVQAAPFLTADAWPTTLTTIPDAVTYSVDGGAQVPCTLPTVVQGVQLLCDLQGISGNHKLVVTATKQPNCTSVPNVSGVCTTYTPWVSPPFDYTSTSTATRSATNLKINIQ